MAERGVHETSPMGSGKRPLDHCRSKTTQARMCEAYVTLGRLSHVKMRHEEDAEKLRALLDERVGGAYESALAKVRRDYEALKDNLEKLYIKSIDDLEAHKLAVEAPTRARVELIEGQKTTAARVEEDLKALMANPDEDTVLRELPEATRNVGRVLKSSVKLVGLHFPEINALTAEDFPSGRLHNVVIAPKRSGDRRKQPSSAQPTAKPKIAGAAAPTAAGESGGGQGCCRDGRRAPGWSERVPPTPTTPRSRPNGEREEEGRGGVEARPCATERAEACDRCACACQASDVWVAYRSLRKRYHALKDQADVEEVRVKVEDRRRELQAEFDTRRGEMEMELEQKRRELMEGGHRLARARAELEEKRKELLESSHGLSEAEVQSLRGIVQASMKECQAVQQESAELREKVLLGQQCLERALQETLAGREEIARRKHHGQVLLARIRYLKGMTSACVDNNIAAGKRDGGGSGGADHGGGLSSGGGGSGDSRDGGDGEGEATTNSFSSSSSTFESGDDDDDCGGNDGNDNNNVSGENNNASDSDVGRTAGDSSTSDDDSDMKTSARPPLPPAYDEVSAFFDDSEADDDDDATISVRVRRGWTEASKFNKASRGAEGTTDEKPKSRFLEKERENLTLEINRLSAELAAAGVSGFDNTRFSNPDETRSNDVSPIQPKPKPTPPPPLARSSQHSKKGPGGVGVPAPRRHAHTPVVDNNNQDGNSINNNHSNINNNSSSSSSNNNNNNHSNNHSNNNSSSSNNNNNHSNNHSNSHSMNNDSNNGVGVGGGSGGGYGAYGGYGMRQPFPEGRRRRRSDHRSGGEPAQARAAGGGFERTKSGRAPPSHPPPHLRPQQQPLSQSWSSSSFAAYPAHPAYRVSGFPREDDDDGVVTGSDMSLSPRSSRKGSSRSSSRGVRCR